MARIQVGSVFYNCTDSLSFKNFVNQDLQSRTDFVPGAMVYASSFYWETPDSTPFPSNMTGVTFIKCNLSNLILPPGNTIVECIQDTFKAQPDGFDWILDEADQPVEKI